MQLTDIVQKGWTAWKVPAARGSLIQTQYCTFFILLSLLYCVTNKIMTEKYGFFRLMYVLGCGLPIKKAL